MEVAGVVRLKHGRMWRALKALGWTQTELGQRSGLGMHSIGDIINMRRRPNLKQSLRIEVAFAEAGQLVDVLGEWPDHFKMKTKGAISVYREIAQDQLAAPSPSASLELKDMADAALSQCTPEEQKLIRLHYIDGLSCWKIANQEGCNNVQRKIENALEKIRNGRTGHGPLAHVIEIEAQLA